ncbi:hypothetical protein DICPUDRAFT_150135 [Dictyostelium purpureum]|uniref:Uncharacterized protein n=1 Tax=Dictyostelium purpureum TaxID=5786 RepID=F0ZFJ2_DICPU|nr:uncharacterized protein DICPUDRAFT_150135 [Dictyostelium purpureum]EGC37304.1 hypothetical protein DICPUDRAFT_150135 [Dictyostelium purpureum]|eukprot:XP_003286192.1 hypothetical protein DICPUDRAFT_150135 [Dictyostelium purpureum]
MVQKKKKSNQQKNVTNSSAVDGFNSLISFFDTGNNDNNEEETKFTALSQPTLEDIEKPQETQIEKPKVIPKKPKRKMIIDHQPNNTNTLSTEITNKDTTTNIETNDSNSNGSEISKILDFKKRELENKELDLMIKEKEIKKQKRDIKDEIDKIKISLNKQKLLLEQNKNSTVSIAIPSDCLKDIESEEMKTYVIEMISRQVTMNKIDEIIVYKTDDYDDTDNTQQSNLNLLLKILEYIETPSYLREELFNTLDKDFFYVDKLNRLNSTQEEVNADDKLYREGVVTDQQFRNQSIISVGLEKQVLISKRLNPGTRVTIDMKQENFTEEELSKIINTTDEQYTLGRVISPQNIKKEGYYWGHHVRLVNSMDEIASTCEYKDTKTYDYSILLSDFGEQFPSPTDPMLNNAKRYNHLLIIFANNHKKFNPADRLNSEVLIPDTHINTLFNFNNVPIRFEENLFVTLSKLKNIFYY